MQNTDTTQIAGIDSGRIITALFVLNLLLLITAAFVMNLAGA